MVDEVKKERIPTKEEKDKLEAEKRKIEAEIEKIKAETAGVLADDNWLIKEREAQARSMQLQERQMLAEAMSAEMDQRSKEMELFRLERAFEADKAMDVFNFVYRFTQSVSESSVKDCISRLVYWDRVDPNCDVEIIFSSPGGSVIDGLVLFDYIMDFRQRGHKVTTVTFGWAASMAGILMQAGDHRIMRKESWLLIHEVSFGASGKVGEIEDTTNWIKRIQNRVLDVFAEGCKRAAANGTATHPMKKLELKKHWTRTDWWVSSDESLRFGLVDEVK